MKKKEVLFLTGSSGLLGFQLLKELLSDPNKLIGVLLRPGLEVNAKQRIFNILKKRNLEKYIDQVIVMTGDITKERLGLEDKNYRFLTENTTRIFHCAALTNFKMSIESLRSVNCLGTENVFKLAENCGFLKSLNYISSMFIAGGFSGSFDETSNLELKKFNNSYEQSKFEAEIVTKKHDALKKKIKIFRPSVIVGEYDTGITQGVGMFYQLVGLLSREIFSELPVGKITKINLIPCDVAANMILELSEYKKNNRIYHIIGEENISLRDLINFICSEYNFQKPLMKDIEEFDFSKLSDIKRLILTPFIPYLNLKVEFSATETLKILKSMKFDQKRVNKKILNKLIKYYLKK